VPGPLGPVGPGPTPAGPLAGAPVAGSLVEGSLLVGAEVAGAEVVGAAVEGAAVVVGALVGAAVVVGATVVVGWLAPDIPPVVAGCATAGRPSVVMVSRPSSVASAVMTNAGRGGRVLLKGPATDEQ
jgi:hypothetical protein